MWYTHLHCTYLILVKSVCIDVLHVTSLSVVPTQDKHCVPYYVHEVHTNRHVIQCAHRLSVTHIQRCMPASACNDVYTYECASLVSVNFSNKRWWWCIGSLQYSDIQKSEWIKRTAWEPLQLIAGMTEGSWAKLFYWLFIMSMLSEETNDVILTFTAVDDFSLQ